MADQTPQNLPVPASQSPQAQYGVGQTPYHRHIGSDSPFVSINDLSGWIAAPSTGDIPTYGSGMWTSLGAATIGVLVSNGSVPSYTSSGSSGQFLQSNGTSGIPVWANSPAKFGGDGSDGALSVVSGTTTISLGNASTVIKNYTSISITGTGTLAFSNPATQGTLIILKSQGDVTLTSSNTCIDASGMGAAGGADGSSGTSPTWFWDGAVHYGLVGANPLSGPNSPGGTGGTLLSLTPLFCTKVWKFSSLTPGSGGGGGHDGNAGGSGVAGTGGSGGRGGGALRIECGGAWNFTKSNGIDVSGKIGANGTNGSAGAAPYGATGGSGAGGGGGGMVHGLYNTLTANTGTVKIAGGNGGNAGTSLTSDGAGGGENWGPGGAGGGASYAGAGGNGGNGNASGSGTSGANGGNGAGATGGTGGSGAASVGVSFPAAGAGGGAGGAEGYSNIEKNTEFA